MSPAEVPAGAKTMALAPAMQPKIIALGFSPAALPMLRQLEQSGLVAVIRWPQASAEAIEPGSRPDATTPAAWLAQEWPTATAVVAVGACGLVTRLLAPLLSDKNRDPAVVVVDPQGRFAIPLLGGHGAGGERLSQEIAALLGGQAVITGSSGGLGQLALDSFGQTWGWRRGCGDWHGLMVRAAASTVAPTPLTVKQESGNRLWQGLEAAEALQIAPGAAELIADPGPALLISHQMGPGCRWHPPCLWLGIGCERDTSQAILERLVERTLEHHGLAEAAVAGVASIDRKGDEPALLALVKRYGWTLRLFGAAALAVVPVPHPSEAVAQEMGTASVAEAASLLAAAGTPPAPAKTTPAELTAATAADQATNPACDALPQLLVPKTIERSQLGERGAATLAVALATQQWSPAQGQLHLVGSGPGRLDLLSGDARRALATASVWVGYGPYLDELEPLRRPDQLRRDGVLTLERARCGEALALACQGLPVALVSSGDSGIYGMAGLAMELWLELAAEDRPAFTVHPGLSAVQVAAARAGAPLMHDFCTISLSDRLTPWEVIERRVKAAAIGDFVTAFYNPRSQGRDWQLGRAVDLLLIHRAATTPVALARQLGRTGESVSLHTLGTLPLTEVDMLSLVLVGNSSSFVKDGHMVTPRGYPGAALA